MSALKVMEQILEMPLIKSPAAEIPGLLQATRTVLLQGLELLFKLDDRMYSDVASAPYNASVGQHYRHILEHFQCLVNGVRSGEINYDARERNQRLETEVTYASVATCDLLRAMKSYGPDMLQRECQVVHSVGYGTASPSRLSSNVARELAYCAGHAIHHYAIVRLITSELGVSVPPEFGFAPSTLKYLSSLTAD